MAKKILFVTPSFKNGGTISCLKSLVPFLRERGFSIDVFALTPFGPNKEYIENYCRVISFTSGSNKVGANKESILLMVVKRIKHFLSKIGVDISKVGYRPYISKLTANGYDSIIAFQEETATQFVSYFDQKNLIAWVHCDYSRITETGKKKDLDIYAHYKKIVFVSGYTRDIFVGIYPSLKDKTVVIHNFIDRESIRKRANSPTSYQDEDNNTPFIVSIGRIDPVKHFTIIPSIVSELKTKGVSLKWFIVGGGDNVEEIENIQKEIKENKVEDVVIMTGNLDNPFPLLKKSKLLVCTSYSEAYPTVIQEATSLGVPSVITDFGSSKEVIIEGKNGIICNIKDMPNVIYDLMTDETRYNALKDSCGKYPSENEKIASQLLNLLC